MHVETGDELSVQLRDVVFAFLVQFVDVPSDDGAHRYYHDQLQRVAEHRDWSTVVIRWSDLAAFDDVASTTLESSFVARQEFLDDALQMIVQQHFAEAYRQRGRGRLNVAFEAVPRCYSVRTLRTALLGQLCALTGTVTRTSQVRPELRAGVFQCGDCGTDSLPIAQPFRYTEPPTCRNPQCENTQRWQLRTEHPQTVFGDWQKLKVQENANQIPMGCMPRTMDIVVRGDAVEVAKPGDRVEITGTPIVVPDVSRLMSAVLRREVQRSAPSRGGGGGEEARQDVEGLSGLRVLGVRDLSYKMCFLAVAVADGNGDIRMMTHSRKEAQAETTRHTTLTATEVERILVIRRSPNVLMNLARCVAPNVYAHDAVKTGVLLQLLGGVPKVTMEGINLRGDINACIIGDPSTAKSQILQWVASVMPHGVYTSGKSSTASGLTATVTRDPDTGERTIEAGALMLSDRGVCCIDEFDKMDIKDQVAIHEAMEQQTISIAKAGINATLNARTSLLAALNPIGGRYDRRRPLHKNIAMSPPIMSRFDLMFCIIDEASSTVDAAIADKIVSLHRLGDRSQPPPLSREDFLLYIKFARSQAPRLTPEASQRIVETYCDMRRADALTHRSRVYRVTTRLLESLIRLSEAVAKLFLSEEVLESHVKIAMDVMQASLSTIDMTEVELVAVPEGPAPEAIRVPEEAKAPPRKGQAKTSKRVTVSAEHYHRVTNFILGSLTRDGPATREAIVRQYLGGLSTNDVAQLQHELQVCQLIVSRMQREGKLTVTASDGADLLAVDPNYDFEAA